jgi:23S rRNA (cytidine1920-2'-O)/16S rRNA (cytidine1409-2'-O)-methyltransferase
MAHKGWKAADEGLKARKEAVLSEISLVVMDLSFISVLKVLPALISWISRPFECVVLVKPQFEARREEVGSGGIIRDSGVHDLVLERTRAGVLELGFEILGECNSPILGGKGNREFFLHLKAA